MEERRSAAAMRLLGTPLIRRGPGLAVPTRPARKPPPAIGARLRPVLGRLYQAKAPGHAGLLLHWPEIVGPDLAAVTEPGKLKEGRGLVNNGILTIRVAGPVALELQHREAQILERVNAFLGYRAAGRLKLVQGPLDGGPRRAEDGAASRPAPSAAPAPSAKERARGAEIAAAVKHEGLRAALARLGAHILAGTESGRETEDTRGSVAGNRGAMP